MRFAGCTPRGFWVGPVHVGLQPRLRVIGSQRARWPFLRVDWSPVDWGCGPGPFTGRSLRIETRAGKLRVQFGGPQPWRRLVCLSPEEQEIQDALDAAGRRIVRMARSR